MNEHDSLKMTALLEVEGYRRVEDQKDADIILFNTCTVREKPHHKAISEVGRALDAKEKRPDLIVGITGCVAQEEKGDLFKIFPSLDLVLGPDQIHRLPDLIKKVSESRCSGVPVRTQSTELIDEYKTCNFTASTPVPRHSGTPVQFIKIIKGCNNFCSFCIVPYVRGREVSNPPNAIIEEIKGLTESGVKEVTLLGQNVNSYGQDNKGFGTFPRLLKRISEETDIVRIRYTSPHPKNLSEDLIEEHRTNPKLCEHIHLPLQAGSTSILRQMNRRYTKEEYLKKVYALKERVPNIAITTDIIVGFPGETDGDFKETLNIMREVEFDGMFAFKYSTRPGTKAAELEDDVPIAVKKVRLAQVLELNEKIVLQKHQKYVGSRQEVLVEGPSQRGGGQLTGRTRTNKIVNFDGKLNLIGSLVDVEIVWAGPNSLRGVCQNEETTC